MRAINVTAEVEDRSAVKPIQQLTLPVTVSITQRRAEETVNLVDAEDAVKYLPSVFLRKRNNGDTQATLATRVWGTSSSARSLIFADGVPLTALVANNNTVGGPRWGLVAPPEVERIDMMMGPYSAAYAGNSMGAVMEITTRLPRKLEAQIQQTQAIQSFDLYGTSRNFMTSQTGASVGDRFGKFAFWASGNYQKSNSQPLSYVTSGSTPTGTTGAYPDSNKLNAATNVLGASGLLNTHMTNGKIKAAYDITPTLRASYTFGLWRNDGNSGVQPYINASTSGSPTYAGQTGFASGFYDVDQRHTAQAFTLRTDRKKTWDLELVGSTYRFGFDQQRFPERAFTDTFSTTGRVAVLDGTGWATLDLKGTWKPGGQISRHTISTGAHWEHYALANTTFNTSNWRDGGSRTSVFTEGDGKTETKALWAQDQWYITPDLKLTVGGRLEDWRGYDGLNVSASPIDCHGTTVAAGAPCVQPTVEGQRFSPKALLVWNASDRWIYTAALGKAYRFATPSELYQLVSTGPTFSSPNPDLKPDNVTSAELRVQRKFERGSLQLSLFQDDVHDAIISQFNTLVPGSTQLFQFQSNVDHVRARGAELAFGTSDVLLHGLAISGNFTLVDPKTLAISGRASADPKAPADAAIGKQLPNIPKFRTTITAMYRPTERFTYTLAGRYSTKLYTTLDNADVRYNTYQGFSDWFVMDTKANYRVNDNWNASFGIDNLLNRKYFLFHPFPQRTFLAGLKYDYR
jgi:iron complex outermembrane receptor protein